MMTTNRNEKIIRIVLAVERQLMTTKTMIENEQMMIIRYSNTFRFAAVCTAFK